MRVVIVRSRSTNPSVNKIATALASGGYDVQLLLWNRLGKRGLERRDGYTVCNVGVKAPHDQSSVVLFLPVWFLLEFLFLMRARYDVIHACDLDTLLPAILAKAIKRVKVCYSIYDFYADIMPQSMPKILRKLVAAIETRGISSADCLFLVNRYQLEQISGARITKVEFLYNAPRDSFAGYAAPNSNRELRVFYAGNLHPARGLEYLVRAVVDEPDVRLVVAGNGPFNDSLKGLAAESRGKVEHLGWLPYDRVIEEEMKADALVALHDPCIPGYRHATPNKLFEAMMCGKPLITSAGTAAAEIVKQEHCGMIVPYGDGEALRAVFRSLRDNAELRYDLGRGGRMAYEARYSWDLMRERLRRAYESMGGV